MEVTKSNFDDVYPKVCKLIDDADFISIDTELTGLGRKGENRHIALDTPEERYAKIRNDITQYTMIQFGLSTFKLDLANKRVQTATYCFYLTGEKNASYKFDAASVEFLATNGFNFNKLFNEGLSYMNIKEEGIVRNNLKYAYVPKNFQVKTTESKNFLVSISANLERLKLHSTGDKMTIPFKTLSSFNQKLMFNNITLKFPTYLIQSANYSVEVTRFETETEKEQYLKNCFEESLQKQIGFGLIGRKIFESKKPIVGHNPVLDVFHLVDKIAASLPESYAEFKALTKQSFSVIYDTKLISKDPPFANKILNNALANVYEELQSTLSDIEIETESGSQSYSVNESKGKAHDAGFDAYMTGISFLAMLKKLQGAEWMKKDPMQLPSLKPYANKLHLMFTHDIPYLDLEKDEVIPSRSNIFVVECPETWNESDLKECFSDLEYYKTYWVNKNKVYVVPQEPASLCLSKVTPKCPANVSVSMYKLPISSNGTVKCVKHTLEDLGENSNSLHTDVKRIKNEESTKMSQMSLNPSTEEPSKVVKEFFNVPDKWT